MSTYDELARLEVRSPKEGVGFVINDKTSITPQNNTQKITQKPAQKMERPRDLSRPKKMEKKSRYPSRNEIQEFSFRLRDQLTVKVQAQVPHKWQKELDEISRELDVKKLELYRFILGEFLGKVKRG